jgi:hypothetical protein
MSVPARTPAEQLRADADAVALEAAPRFARWDAGAWRRLCDGPYAQLAARRAPDATRRAWLRLAAEALGLGHLDRDSLARWVITQLLPRHPRTEPVELARVWNIAESFAPLAPWLHRQAIAAVSSPASMHAEVVAMLARVLGDVSPARFVGPFSISTHAPDSISFLPGRLHFVAPRVLCVHDRLRRGAHLAWELGPEPKLLGAGECLGASLVAETPRVQAISPVELRVGATPVALPRVKLYGDAAVSPAGFVAFAVVDSQRVWVATSP